MPEDARPVTSGDIAELRRDIKDLGTQIAALALADANGRTAMADQKAEFIGLLAKVESSVQTAKAAAELSITKAEAASALATEKVHNEASIVGLRTLIIWSILAVIGSGLAIATVSLVVNKIAK